MTRALLVVMLCLLAAVPQRVCVCDHPHHTSDHSDHDCPCQTLCAKRIAHPPPRLIDPVETGEILELVEPVDPVWTAAPSVRVEPSSDTRPQFAIPVYLSTARLRT